MLRSTYHELVETMSAEVVSFLSEESSVESPRLGLVLGGGAALGAAHVGVLEVFE